MITVIESVIVKIGKQVLKAEDMTTNRNGPMRLCRAASECGQKMRLCKFLNKQKCLIQMESHEAKFRALSQHLTKERTAIGTGLKTGALKVLNG